MEDFPASAVLVQFSTLKNSKSLTVRRFAVHILDVLYDAMKHVHHVSKTVLGPASTKEVAICRAPRHALASHVMSAVPENYLADTNVQQYVVKYVQRTTAKDVQSGRKLELIFLK